MSDNDLRLEKLLNKVIDDYYAFDEIQTQLLIEDWVEIKQAIKDIARQTFGSIHNNLFSYLKLEMLFTKYENSGLILDMKKP